MTLYTVWYRILREAEDINIRRKELWSRENVTGFTYHKELAADTRYVFAVTAWNKWGESAFESDKIFIVSTNFTDSIKTTTLLQTSKMWLCQIWKQGFFYFYLKYISYEGGGGEVCRLVYCFFCAAMGVGKSLKTYKKGGF